MASEPRCFAFADGVRLNGGGLTGRFVSVFPAGLAPASAFEGQTNLSMHFRFGGDAGSVCTGSDVGRAGVVSCLPLHANAMHRLRPRVASTGSAEVVGRSAAAGT